MRLPKESGPTWELVARPSAYFADQSHCPPHVALTVSPPPIEALDERLAAVLAGRVDAARRKAAQSGSSFLGVAKILSASFVKRARSFEVRRKIIPRVAARCMFLRTRLLDADRAFRRAYREALERWRDGARNVEFPSGTWWMAVFHGAGRCAPAPAPA
jgi:hypothetical protein